jgi:hypothetical protein
MVISWWSLLGLRWPAVCHWSLVTGHWSLVTGGLGLELGAQPPGVAGGAAGTPFGALGAAGGPGQGEHALGGALRLGVGQPLAVAIGGELGELVHGGHLLSRR